jgi:hypothetical protein
MHGPCQGVITRTVSSCTHPRVEAGSNTSALALRVVGGDKRGIQCLRGNWVTLFLGGYKYVTWPSRLGESGI